MPCLVFAEFGGHLTEVFTSSKLLQCLQNLALLFAKNVVALVIVGETMRLAIMFTRSF